MKSYYMVALVTAVFWSGCAIAADEPTLNDEPALNNVYANSQYGNLRPYLHLDKAYGNFRGGLNFIGGNLPGVGINGDYEPMITS